MKYKPKKKKLVPKRSNPLLTGNGHKQSEQSTLGLAPIKGAHDPQQSLCYAELTSIFLGHTVYFATTQFYSWDMKGAMDM